MKKSIFLVFLFLAVGIFVVINTTESSGPGKYSENLTREYLKVQEKLSSLEEIIDSRSFVTLKLLRKKSQVQIAQSIEKVNQMEGFEGSDQFRSSILNLLDFYNRFVQNDLSELLDICQKDKTARSDYDRDRLDRFMADFNKREESYLSVVQNAEKTFFKIHHLSDN